MSATTSVRCDGDHCDKVKGEANHWHSVGVWTFERGEKMIALGYIINSSVLLDHDRGTEYTKLDFCSERCLIGYVSRFVGQEQPKGV